MDTLKYLLQANVNLAIFYCFYWYVLRHETFHNYNRAFLLSAVVLSFAVPLWDSVLLQSWFVTQQTSQFIANINLSAVTVMSNKEDSALSFVNVLGYTYLVGCSFFSFKFLASIVQLFRFIASANANQKTFSFFNNIFVGTQADPNNVLYDHELVHATQLHSLDVLLLEIVGIFCWFNPIIYAYKRALKNIHEFIADEQACKAMPSKADYAELLFSEQFQTHPSVLVSNFFTKTSLKLRIEMLIKSKSQKMAVLKYGLSLPAFIVMLVFATANINAGNVNTIFENPNVVVGQVLNQDTKKPVVGANIVAKGSNKGTSTDIKGRFVLTQTDKYKTWVVSHIGYEIEEIVLNKPVKQLSVSLRTLQLQLGEVVVAAWSPVMNKEKPGQTLLFTNEEIDSLKNSSTQKNVDNKIYTVVEENAQFPGGNEGLGKFLMQNLMYPDEASKNNISGKVFLSFIVKKDGTIREINILKGLSHGLNEEAVRVVAQMPKWKPGMQNGSPVNSKFNLPISFVLDKK